MNDITITNLRCPYCAVSLSPKRDQFIKNHGLYTLRCYACHKLLWFADTIGTLLKDQPVSEPNDPVNHPSHYTSHPSGIECIQITEHMNFCLGNAVKYIWRAAEKGNQLEDLKKARWYLDREIAQLEQQP